ncbi:ABC-type transport auxiliary lipoprotein family protein [Pseudomonas nitroreducens]|uniref:ABC-type transport auxiliary lipoprotein component domain-containing protein n=1 Tax=Pseudomonas nitroreducens TaxID=46680 RepID=A0A246F9A1_PSENT|nr:hypothetical protein CEG18_17115 [Pseudomonas nitroreducens]
MAIRLSGRGQGPDDGVADCQQRARALSHLAAGPARQPASAQVRVERVILQRFDSVPGQYSLVDAQWRLSTGGGEKSPACRSSLQTRADNSVDSLVAAHQSNLCKLAEQVAQASAGGANACP